MKATTSGRRTDLFIGTLSTFSRDNGKHPVPDDSPPPNRAPLTTQTGSLTARLRRQAKPDDVPARSIDHCEHEFPVEFLEPRVAPVRSAGSPVARLDWR